MAEWTGLEPVTSGVTGRYSNQLNYHSVNKTTVIPCLQETHNRGRLISNKYASIAKKRIIFC